MNDDESLEGDGLELALFSDQSLLGLAEFIALLGHYKRAVYEHYAGYMDPLV